MPGTPVLGLALFTAVCDCSALGAIAQRFVRGTLCSRAARGATRPHHARSFHRFLISRSRSRLLLIADSSLCVPHSRAVNLKPCGLQHFHHPLDTEPADLESSHGINETLVHRSRVSLERTCTCCVCVVGEPGYKIDARTKRILSFCSSICYLLRLKRTLTPTPIPTLTPRFT